VACVARADPVHWRRFINRGASTAVDLIPSL